MVVYIATVDGAVLCSATYCDTASEKAGKVEEGVCRRSAAAVDAARAVDVRVLRGSRGVRRGIAPAGAEKRDPPQGLSVRVEGVPGPWRVTAVRGKGE